MCRFHVTTILLLIAGAVGTSGSAASSARMTGETRNDGVPPSPSKTEESVRRLQSDGTPPKISAYQPDTNVFDYLVMDLDVAAINAAAARNDEDSVYDMEDVYREGGHSQPYAIITLRNGLPQPIAAGTACLGVDTDSESVRLYARKNYAQGEKQLELVYDDANTSPGGSKCQVGGLLKIRMEGCLRNEGDIYITGVDALDYFYDAELENYNARTISDFSTTARASMAQCGNSCPYEEYTKFVEYYGRYDYAEQWMNAALDLRPTEFENGDADWSKYDDLNVAETIRQGVVYLHIWMKVVERLERAVSDCSDCLSIICPANPENIWSQAVAYYSGSQVANENSTMLYYLADIRCGTFETCAPDSDTLEGGQGWSSVVNVEIFRLFSEAKDLLNRRSCLEVVAIKNRIIELMRIPLIQGALRYAHINANDQIYTEKHQVESATFAAAILPAIHKCSPDDAKIIYQAMKADSEAPKVDYPAVKRAFERNYECLNITCADVGGIYDQENDEYLSGAAPCSDSTTRRKFDRDAVRIAVFTFVGIGGALVVAIIVSYVKCKKDEADSKREIEMMQAANGDSELKLEENAVIS